MEMIPKADARHGNALPKAPTDTLPFSSMRPLNDARIARAGASVAGIARERVSRRVAHRGKVLPAE